MGFGGAKKTAIPEAVGVLGSYEVSAQLEGQLKQVIDFLMDKRWKGLTIAGRAIHNAALSQCKLDVQSFVGYFLGSFGGGILTPLVLGKVPVPLLVDELILTAFIVFVIFGTTTIAGNVYRSPPVKFLGLLLEAMFRVRLICSMALSAAEILPSRFGPLICGTLAGTGGAFLPMSKGLDALKPPLKGTIFRAALTALAVLLFTQHRYGLVAVLPVDTVTAGLIVVNAVYDVVTSFLSPPPISSSSSSSSRKTTDDTTTFLVALIALLVGAFLFIVVGEPLDSLDAVYLAAMTLSSIGFGDVAPRTQAGKVVGMLLMIIASSTFARAAAIAYKRAHVGSTGSTAQTILSALAVLLAFGLTMARTEQWDPFTATYFAVTASTTTGYGDVVPTTPQGKLLTIAFSFLVTPALADLSATLATIVETFPLFNKSKED